MRHRARPSTRILVHVLQCAPMRLLVQPVVCVSIVSNPKLYPDQTLSMTLTLPYP